MKSEMDLLQMDERQRQFHHREINPLAKQDQTKDVASIRG